MKQHLATLTVGLLLFAQDPRKAGWDKAHAKWESLGVKTIDLRIAPGQAHGFFNRGPCHTVTLIAGDRFLVKQGLLTGEPPLQAPSTAEELIPAPHK